MRTFLFFLSFSLNTIFSPRGFTGYASGGILIRTRTLSSEPLLATPLPFIVALYG